MPSKSHLHTYPRVADAVDTTQPEASGVCFSYRSGEIRNRIPALSCGQEGRQWQS